MNLKDFPDATFIHPTFYTCPFTASLTNHLSHPFTMVVSLSLVSLGSSLPLSRDTRVKDDQSEEMNESDEVMGKERPWGGFYYEVKRDP